jgi:hypothetical protein
VLSQRPRLGPRLGSGASATRSRHAQPRDSKRRSVGDIGTANAGRLSPATVPCETGADAPSRSVEVFATGLPRDGGTPRFTTTRQGPRRKTESADISHDLAQGRATPEVS